MNPDELLAQDEATGDEEVVREARRLYEQALAALPDDAHGQPLSSVSCSAFLLERAGRLRDAMDAWHASIDWSETRGYARDTVWPTQELERLRREIATDTREPPAR